jgi:hypothetical protein
MGVIEGNPCSAAYRLSVSRHQQRRETILFLGQHVCWLGFLSGVRTVVCGTLFFPPVFHPPCCFLVIAALPVCPGLPSGGMWVSWSTLLSVCVWRLPSIPPCVSHQFLSV